MTFGAKYEAELLRQAYKENKEGVEYLRSLLMVDGFAPGTEPMSQGERGQWLAKMVPQLGNMQPDRALQIMNEMDGLMEGEEGVQGPR